MLGGCSSRDEEVSAHLSQPTNEGPSVVEVGINQSLQYKPEPRSINQNENLTTHSFNAKTEQTIYTYRTQNDSKD